MGRPIEADMDGMINAATVGVFVVIGCLLTYYAVLRPQLWQLDRSIARLSRRASELMAQNLYSAFGLGHESQNGRLSLVHFTQVCIQLVDEPFLDGPPSGPDFAMVQFWRDGRWQYARVAKIFWEVDLLRLPYGTSLDDFLRARDKIERHTSFAFQGRVSFTHSRYGPTGLHSRLIAMVVYAGREKRPTFFDPDIEVRKSITEELSDYQLLASSPEREDDSTALRALLSRVIEYSLKNLQGYVPYRALWVVFQGEIGQKRLAAILDKWQRHGYLLPAAGPNGRRLDPARLPDLVNKLKRTEEAAQSVAHNVPQSACAPLRMIDQDFEPDDGSESEDLEC